MRALLELELRFQYADGRTAESVLSAVSPENGGYVEARLEGNTIIYSMSAENAGRLRNTADDLMACIKVAEDAAGLVSEDSSGSEERSG